MPGVSRVSQDSAGGTIIGILAPTVFVNGTNIVCEGAQVTPHGLGYHASPVMEEHSPNVYANQIPICRQGDVATCDDPATGSSNVFANDGG
jgi:uncharacterized Zn-binding protein involved in type VI secretion